MAFRVRHPGAGVLQWCAPFVRDDEEVARRAIRCNPTAFRFLSDRLRRDRRMALEAVKRDGMLLRVLPTEFQEDLFVAREAVWQDRRALIFAKVDCFPEMGEEYGGTGFSQKLFRWGTSSTGGRDFRKNSFLGDEYGEIYFVSDVDDVVLTCASGSRFG